jgi:hypothetical protein
MSLTAKPEWRIFRESLNHHGHGGNHLNNTSITILQEFRLLLNLFTRTSVNLGNKLSKLDSNVGGVTVKNRGIAISNLSRPG